MVLIGVLLEARHRRLTPALKPPLDALRDIAGFRISDALSSVSYRTREKKVPHASFYRRYGKRALDLALERAGVGGDPDGGAVGLGPERGGREVTEGLADPGAGLGQHHPRLAFTVAGLFGLGNRGVDGGGVATRRASNAPVIV
jgi:hypothetical protein